MQKLSNESLLNLLEQNPIAEYFRNVTELTQSEKGFVCSCPFHAGIGKTCAVYPETHSFYCTECGIGGDVITFIRLTQNLSYESAVQYLTKQTGTATVPAEQEQKERCYQINKETANFYYLNLLYGADKSGLAYFQKRQLRPETIRKYGLGFAPDDWHQLGNYLRQKGFSEEEMLLANVCRKSEKGNIYDNFRNRVIFPITDMQKRVIGFGGRVLDDSKPKYLNTSDTPVFDKGRNLFSLYFAGTQRRGTIILAEGYMDVIAMNQAGFENAVATLGTAITPQQAQLISRYADEVIVSYDSDTAGQKATQKAIRHFQTVGLPVRILHIDNQAKDPDEYLKQKDGAERFRLLLRNARKVTDFLLDRCKNDLDLQTEAGKVAYLRKSVQVLAEISNPNERETYISRKADELHIRKEILTEQVNRTIQKNQKIQSKIMFHELENAFVRTDALNPQAREHPKESKSEEMLLSCLMQFPETYPKISAVLQPEDFITDFHRKIYTALCRVLSENNGFFPSFLSDEFSIEEMSRIIRIFVSYRNIDLSETVISDCIHNLQNSKTQAFSQSADLQRLIENRKKTIQWIK